MFVCDTNVIAEVMKPRPDADVVAWLGACRMADLWTTTISRMEIASGIGRLPAGRRRARLQAAARELFAAEFGERVLSFDSSAADACAEIRADREAGGRPISLEDAMIAAISRVHGMTVVTRDEGGFDGCGVAVINPWRP